MSPRLPRHLPSDCRVPPPRYPHSPLTRPKARQPLYPPRSPRQASSSPSTRCPRRSLCPRRPHTHRFTGETSSAVHNICATSSRSAASQSDAPSSSGADRTWWELPQRCVRMRGTSGGRWGLKMLLLGEAEGRVNGKRTGEAWGVDIRLRGAPCNGGYGGEFSKSSTMDHRSAVGTASGYVFRPRRPCHFRLVSYDTPARRHRARPPHIPLPFFVPYRTC